MNSLRRLRILLINLTPPPYNKRIYYEKIEWKIINNIEWRVDENNNKCSVRYFGSKKASEKALKLQVQI